MADINKNQKNNTHKTLNTPAIIGLVFIALGLLVMITEGGSKIDLAFFILIAGLGFLILGQFKNKNALVVFEIILVAIFFYYSSLLSNICNSGC